MKRFKKHKVKSEAQTSSTSFNKEQEAHDLAYYIHDRVELMHQVFSVLKYKELKAMAPACIRHIPLDDLQELCTEELLGISSKRLCAILDGADPPSDTESSSQSPPPEQMETISLDSISSDDEILSQSSSKKKKHKHRRHSSKSKSKRKKSKEDDEQADRSKASRAGLTVLELLELQARARAIRAQLQQEQHQKPAKEASVSEPANSSDNEVEIKEEPTEVVEISSDEDKPKVEELQKKIIEEKEKDTQPISVIKRINDLVITVPQKPKQKIKLTRNKPISVATEATSSVTSTHNAPNNTEIVATKDITVDKSDKINKTSENKKDKTRKKKKHKKNVSKDDIDNDEITLQLSDTEKMDLLEDLDRKNYDSVSSCSSSSSESSSESDSSKKEVKNQTDSLKDQENNKGSEENTGKVHLEVDTAMDIEVLDTNVSEKGKSPEKVNAGTEKTDSVISDIEKDTNKMEIVNNDQNPENAEDKAIQIESDKVQDTSSITTSKDTTVMKEQTATEEPQAKDREKNMSEGELSDRESSEIEALDLKPEVVCISDEESNNKSKKKKKKKDKKSKKEKKSKKKSDFRDGADQNFYKKIAEAVEDSSQKKIFVNSSVPDSLSDPPTKSLATVPSTGIIEKVDLTATDTKPSKEETVKDDAKNVNSTSDDDVEAVYEILELSDDSSCCEVEHSILSKEPTAQEIEALSAKIDEIDRVEVITDREIREYEKRDELDEAENISWKDRYLDSKKVKTVLNTANILNALRKKNIDLKRKLAESKKIDEEEKAPEPEDKEEEVLEEGSIEQFNTLEALTKYVDPVKEVTKDLKKDAKLLLKMYKKLLKYNDINKGGHPTKKKKKKKKKAKKVTKDTKEKHYDMIEITKEIDTISNNIVNEHENTDGGVNSTNITRESETDDETVRKEANSGNGEVISVNKCIDKETIIQ